MYNITFLKSLTTNFLRSLNIPSFPQIRYLSFRREPIFFNILLINYSNNNSFRFCFYYLELKLIFFLARDNNIHQQFGPQTTLSNICYKSIINLEFMEMLWFFINKFVSTNFWDGSRFYDIFFILLFHIVVELVILFRILI